MPKILDRLEPGSTTSNLSKLFNKAIETEECEITNFKTTFNLVNILMAKQGD